MSVEDKIHELVFECASEQISHLDLENELVQLFKENLKNE